MPQHKPILVALNASQQVMHYIIIHIGNNNPVGFMKFIEVLGKLSGKKGNKEYFAMQPGNVPETYADVDDLTMTVEFKPATPIEKESKKFVEWYLWY